MHGWDETDEWTQMPAIMLPAKAPVLDGKELPKDLGALFAAPSADAADGYHENSCFEDKRVSNCQ
jgi:hypothetical protein